LKKNFEEFLSFKVLSLAVHRPNRNKSRWNTENLLLIFGSFYLISPQHYLRLGLHMPCLRKLVDGLEFEGFVSAVFEDSEVAGECGGVAGDVDDFFWFYLKDGF
jgi:hypothetical protein